MISFENDIYTLKDITDPEQSKYYREQLAKMFGVDLNDPDIENKLKDKKIVMPKESSRLSQYAKNSEAMEKWIVKNYDQIKSGEAYDDRIEFPLDGLKGAIKDESRGLYATIHKANIRNARVNPDGSFTAQTDDPYNYEEWDDNIKMHDEQGNLRNPINVWLKNKAARINNRAYKQQENNQLEDLYLSMPFTYTEEEIDKLKRKYKKR